MWLSEIRVIFDIKFTAHFLQLPLRPINGPPNPTDPLTDPKLIPSPSPSNEPQMGPPTQHDGVRTTMKKDTPKMLSKSISRMPMGSMAGH